MKNPFKPKLKLIKGTRFASFLFIACSILIAAGILFAANMYYNIDTGEIVMEEIQRVTGMLRATAGVIIGGTATQDPAAGYGFEVATSSLFSAGDVVLSAADQLLRFTGGTGDYVGFRATTTLGTTTVYTWPSVYGSAGQALITAADGALSWSTPAGMGDITAVGDVTSTAAFTTSTVAGTSLWFHDSGSTGKLTIGTLTANATYTLPDLTGTIALSGSGSLGTGGVLFADSGLIATSTNFYWNDGSRYLRIGDSATAGQLRIYSSHASGYYLGFAATSTMTATTTYYWPADYGINNYVLTTDGAGQLQWESATGTGAVIGTGSANQVAYFTDENTIAGDAGFTFASSTDKLTLVGGLIVPLIEYAGELEIKTTGSGNNILLNPVSGIVQLATSTYIRTNEGYEIGRAGTQVLREMIPILGFDLPVQTATTSYVKISKALENYPFQSAATGTTRVHKLVFRYSASTTDPIEWRVSTTTGQTYSSSTLTTPTSNDLEQGNAYVATTTIPADGTDWWIDIKTPVVSDVVRVFQIFLAAYDQID